jgi:mannose-6-phosphate isomerase-like protein (cupin superfamily)
MSRRSSSRRTAGSARRMTTAPERGRTVDRAMTSHPTTPVHAFAVESVEGVDAPRSRPRVHARLETSISVTEGVVYVVADEHDHVLTPGDTLVIPAGTSYQRFNAGDDEARFVETYRAALAQDLCPEVEAARALSA